MVGDRPETLDVQAERRVDLTTKSFTKREDKARAAAETLPTI